MSNRLVFLLAAVAIPTSSHAWMSHPSPTTRLLFQRDLDVTLEAALSDDDLKTEISTSSSSSPLRRRLLLSGPFLSLLAAKNAHAAPPPPPPETTTDAASDPFLQMDAMIQKTNFAASSSNYPNSISPLPTTKLSETDLTAPATTDMEAAINESRASKRIDPRTHG